MQILPPGPVIADVAGLELTDAERVRLRHPLAHFQMLSGWPFRAG